MSGRRRGGQPGLFQRVLVARSRGRGCRRLRADPGLIGTAGLRRRDQQHRGERDGESERHPERRMAVSGWKGNSGISLIYALSPRRGKPISARLDAAASAVAYRG